MFKRILSKIFHKSFNEEINSYRKYLDNQLQEKLNEFDAIRIENNIENKDDLIEELKKIVINGFTYKFTPTVEGRGKKLLFHLFNDGDISKLQILPKEVKLIQLYLKDEISFEDDNDFLNNSKTKFKENTEIVAVNEIDFFNTINRDSFNDFLNLNDNIELEPIQSIPNFEIIDEYSKIISAAAISLNIQEYNTSGSNVYKKAYRNITNKIDFENQIGGYPYWNSIYLESQYSHSIGKLKFLAQYKFQTEYAHNNSTGIMCIYFFFDKNTSKIIHFFVPKLIQESRSFI